MSETQSISWKRVTVEGAAIVASILLAFAIDAWWDDRIERVEEGDILASLQTEFEANKDSAAAVLHVHEESLRYAAILMSLTEDEILALSDTEIERHVRYFAYPVTFDAVRGSIDALIASGKLGILRDKQLRESLTTFVNIVDDAKEDREYMSRWAMIIWQEVSKDGGPYRKVPRNTTIQECADDPSRTGCFITQSIAFLPAATPEDLLRFRKNAVFMGYVNQSHEVTARYASEIMKAQDQIETILALIDGNL